MDSIKKKRAIHGVRKETAFAWRLNSLTDRMISMTNQTIFSGGTNIKRYSRRVNPESMRLNPKIRSYLPPRKRISGNCVNIIAITLKIFNLSSNNLV